MRSMTRWWAVAPLAAAMAVAACGGDDGDGSAAEASTAPATATSAPTDATATSEAGTVGAGAGVMLLGGEEIAMGPLRCYFEEQSRAGLGGQFTHTAQAQGVDAQGVQVMLDLSRARAEDGTVEDDVIVDIGDPLSDDAVSLMASGAEGLIQFGDASAAAEGIEVSDFGGDPLTLTFDLDCS